MTKIRVNKVVESNFHVILNNITVDDLIRKLEEYRAKDDVVYYVETEPLYSGGYIVYLTQDRLETDDEHERRLRRENFAKSLEERKERVMLERLLEKYGVPDQKVEDIPYPDW